MPKILPSICDESVFSAFFEEHARSLRNYLYYKFGDEESAEDVAQESFVRLWNNCSKVPFEKAKSYVYTIATNLSTSIKRHEKVQLKYQERNKLHDRSNESPEFLVLEQEFMEKLNNAISKLPDKQREAFLMSRVEKKTYKEIAEIARVSIKAIEKLMHKALVKMRKEIGDV